MVIGELKNKTCIHDPIGISLLNYLKKVAINWATTEQVSSLSRYAGCYPQAPRTLIKTANYGTNWRNFQKLREKSDTVVDLVIALALHPILMDPKGQKKIRGYNRIPIEFTEDAKEAFEETQEYFLKINNLLPLLNED